MWIPTVLFSQIKFGENYKDLFQIKDLGSIPASYGKNYALVRFKKGDPNTIYLGIGSITSEGALLEVPLVRNALSKQIVALGTPNKIFDVVDPENSSIDGGLVYVDAGKMLITTWPNGYIGEFHFGDKKAKKWTKVKSLPNWEHKPDPSIETTNSPGPLVIVPEGMPGEGAMKICSWNSSGMSFLHDLDYSKKNANGNYLFSVSKVVTSINFGPEAMIYLKKGSYGFDKHKLHLADFGKGTVWVYDVDENGNPIVGNRTLFFEGAPYLMGADIDPLTGDIIYSQGLHTDKLLLVSPKNANLRTVVSISKDVAYAGEIIELKVQVTNHFNDVAEKVTCAFGIPNSFDFVSDNSAGAYDLAKKEWNIGDIAAGEVKEITIQIKGKKNSATPVRVQGEVSAAKGTMPDIVLNDVLDYTVLLLPCQNLIDKPENVAVCGSYTLPPLLVGGQYFQKTGGKGKKYKAGDVIDSSQQIFVYSKKGVDCEEEHAFKINILEFSQTAKLEAVSGVCANGAVSVNIQSESLANHPIFHRWMRKGASDSNFVQFANSKAFPTMVSITEKTTFYREDSLVSDDGVCTVVESNRVDVDLLQISGNANIRASADWVCLENNNDPIVLEGLDKNLQTNVPAAVIEFNWLQRPLKDAPLDPNDLSGFVEIPQSNSQNHSVQIQNESMQFLRKLQLTLGSVQCEYFSNVLTLRTDFFIGNTQIEGPEIVCKAQTLDINVLTEALAVPDSNTRFQWQQSTDNVYFTDIANATSPKFPSGSFAVNQDVFIRRMDLIEVEGVSCFKASNSVEVKVNRFTQKLQFEKPSPICEGSEIQLQIIQESAVLDGNLNHQWWRKDVGGVYQQIPGATKKTFPSGQLLQGITQYKRVDWAVIDGVSCSPLETEVTVHPLEILKEPQISSSFEKICERNQVKIEVEEESTSNGGVFSYRWMQKKESDTNFVEIGDTASFPNNIFLEETTEFKRVDTLMYNGTVCLTVSSNTIKISIFELLGDVDIISDTNFVCLNEGKKVVNLSSKDNALNAPVGFVLQFQWFQRPLTQDTGVSGDLSGFVPIAGETNLELAVEIEKESMQFYREVYALGKGLRCVYHSNVYTIHTEFFDKTCQISIPKDKEVVCAMEPLQIQIDQEVAALHMAKLQYQWQSSTDGKQFADIIGANDPDVLPTSFTLEEDIFIRRKTIAIIDEVSCSQFSNMVAYQYSSVQNPVQIKAPTILCKEAGIHIEVVEPPTDEDYYEFQWWKKTAGEDYKAMGGISNSAAFPPNQILSETTTYKLETWSIAGLKKCGPYVSTVTVEAYEMTPAILATNRPLLCEEENVGIQILKASEVSNTAYTLIYQWEKSTDGIHFSEVPNAITSVFPEMIQIDAPTYFRRRDIAQLPSTTCQQWTNSVRISMNSDIMVDAPNLMSTQFSNCDAANNFGLILQLDPGAISGGVAPYSFAIYDSRGTIDKADDILLQARDAVTRFELGGYTVNEVRIAVYDKNDCSADVILPLPIRTKFEVFDVKKQLETCQLAEDGKIEVSFKGGIGPYRVQLQKNNQLLEQLTGITSNQHVFEGLKGDNENEYVIEVEDSNGCLSRVLLYLKESNLSIGVDKKIEYNCFAPNVEWYNRVEVVLKDPKQAKDMIYVLDKDRIGEVQQSDAVFFNLSDGAHTIHVLHRGGCPIAPIQFSINNYQPLSLQADLSTINMVKIVAKGGVPPYTYRFANSEEVHTNPEFPFASSGTYVIRVIDSKGCEEEISVEVVFFDIEIPSHFSPNGDGINDVFGPKYADAFLNSEMLIFDRYGRILKTLKNKETWDGSYHNNDLPSGEYWYILKLNDLSQKREYIGHVTIVR